MKKIIKLLLIFILVSCEKDEKTLLMSNLESPRVMCTFCQSSPNDTLRKIMYNYDNENLTKETTFRNGDIESIITYTYKSNKQLITEITETDWLKTEKNFEYNDLNQLVNIAYTFIYYDNSGQVIDEREFNAPREYVNNQLVKEWEYWGGFNTYEYNNGKLATKIDYTANGEKHHITRFKYSNDLLIEEKKETNAGSLMYLKRYKYDSRNRLILIKPKFRIREKLFL